MKNLQQCTKIRIKEILEVVGRIFWDEDAIGFQLAPVLDGWAQTTFHALEATAKIVFLPQQRHFEKPLENLFVTKLDSLLNRFRGIDSAQPCMLVTAAGEIAKRSDIDQAPEEIGYAGKGGRSEILDDCAVLLKLA